MLVLAKFTNCKNEIRHSDLVCGVQLCGREVVGSIPRRAILKTLKMVLDAVSSGTQH